MANVEINQAVLTKPAEVLPSELAMSYPGINTKDFIAYKRDTWKCMFIATLLTRATKWNVDIHQPMKRYWECGIYTQGNNNQPLRKMKSWNLNLNGWNQENCMYRGKKHIFSHIYRC